MSLPLATGSMPTRTRRRNMPNWQRALAEHLPIQDRRPGRKRPALRPIRGWSKSDGDEMDRQAGPDRRTGDCCYCSIRHRRVAALAGTALDGGKQPALHLHPGTGRGARRLSPGRQNACLHLRQRSPQSHKIYVHNVAGGDGIKVTNDAYNDVSPAWSPDGTRPTAYVATKPG